VDRVACGNGAGRLKTGFVGCRIFIQGRAVVGPPGRGRTGLVPTRGRRSPDGVRNPIPSLTPAGASAALCRSESPYGGNLVNAAFVLLTTACLAGDNPPAPPAASPAPAPVVSAPVAGCSGCGASYDTCGCETHHHRLGGLFHRNKGCGCEETPACNTCSGHQLFGGHHAASCGCETASCGCEDTGGHHRRFGGLFHRHHEECGCETCGGCGTTGTVTPAPATTIPNAEPIPAPKEPAKKMPSTSPAPGRAASVIDADTANPF